VATSMPVEVTVEIAGVEVVAGNLWIHERRARSATFAYAEAYLRNPLAYDLDPMLARGTGVFQTPTGKEVFNAFSDGSPDRWGQNLMRREEQTRAKAAGTTPRSLSAADFLFGTRDDLRQGAIRFRRPGTDDHLSSSPAAVPKIVSLSRLLRATDRFVGGGTDDRDLKDLIKAGGSLGGARPKAAVRTAAGTLMTAKFPRKGSDEWDVIGWEKLENNLAARSGIAVALTELVTVAGRNVLLSARFDREGAQRVGFASALTMLEASEGDLRSYLEIAEALAQRSNQASQDLEQLYRRIVFSILTSNVDDHLRNHAFLRRRTDWVLSPAYDLNPDPKTTGFLSTAVDFDDPSADIDLALSVADYFRLSRADAKGIVAEVELATRGWAAAARALGLPVDEVDLMGQAFETEQRQVARRLGA